MMPPMIARVLTTSPVFTTRPDELTDVSDEEVVVEDSEGMAKNWYNWVET